MTEGVMAVILELILEFVLSPLRSKHFGWIAVWVVAAAILVALIALLLYARAPVDIATN